MVTLLICGGMILKEAVILEESAKGEWYEEKMGRFEAKLNFPSILNL